MQTRSTTFRRLLFIAALALFLPLAASQAQTVINSLPYVITTPGDYVLGGNLSFNATSGNAITFAVGNVTLDFNGHYLSGLGAGKGTQAYGLYAKDRANITIQNGTVVGFYYGIEFDGSSGGNNTGNVVTNMRVPSCTYVGIALNYPVTCRVEGCQVNKTGGTTANGAGSDTFGSATIKNNQVSTVTPVGSGFSGYGIYCTTSTSHFVIGNQVDNCTVGVFMSVASKRQDNLTGNCSTAFQGGTDAGGNN